MTITYNTLVQSVKRHLSVIGKRLYDKQGNNMFSNITASTAEDPIFTQYLAAGVQTVESAFREFISSWTDNGTSVTFTLTNTRSDTGFDGRAQKLIETYLVLFCVGEFIAMTHPDYAQKYQADANGAMLSLNNFIFYKKPPVQSASSYSDITGSVTTD